MKAQWIYFEVPYSKEATQMRALLGYTSDESTTLVLISETCKDVP